MIGGDLSGGAARARLVAVGLALAFAVLAVRGGLIALSGEAGVAVRARAEAPPRADIVDRNGELLATSVTVYSLFADPRAIWNPLEVARQLQTAIPDIDVDALAARLSNRDRAFEWVRRGLTPRQRHAVFALGLEGLDFRAERRRAYPRGTLAGHVLGYSNLDGRGLAGVEFAFDERLSENRDPLRLTLDTGVQFALETELSAAAARYDAVGGAGAVIDAASGEVLGLASWPPADPNRWPEMPADVRLNRAVGAGFELGSIFKPFTVAAGLEAGVVTPAERFDLRAGIEVGAKLYEDDHGAPPADASLADIIAESSNVGAVTIAVRVGVERHKDFLDRLGLLTRSSVELAGGADPILPAEWTDLDLASVSFGHALTVSPIAFAEAFTAFANNGEVAAATLIADQDDRPPPRRAMGAPTAAYVTAMLRETVRRGTGQLAEVAGYRVAGKTGTAEKIVDGAYDPDKNVTSFAALFPADDPKYVVLIVLDEPKAGEVGGVAALNAAPAVGRVIERIAPLLGVAPVFDDAPPSARAVADRRAL